MFTICPRDYTWPRTSTLKKDVDFFEQSEDLMLRVSFFLWVVMFNLTIFWVRENSSFLFRTQKSCSLSSLQPAALLMLSVCRVLPWCLLRILVCVNVPPGDQRDRKKAENSISVCKTLLHSLTSKIV